MAKSKATSGLADRIRREVGKRGWTMYWVGQQTGIPATSLYRFMRGTSDLSLDNAGLVLDLLGWTPGNNTRKGK